MIKPFEKIIELGDGRSITIETGKLAKQADGSVVVKMGGTYLLAAVVSAKEAKPDVDFMPLSVDYKEKFASVVVSLVDFKSVRRALLIMKYWFPVW